jgi:hypothetical protein
MIVVEVFDEDDGWYWHAEQCRLRRGPFADREEADDDANDNVEALIAALTAPGLRQR